MTARTAIYARYSSDLSRDASIEDQVRLCRTHAERQGWQGRRRSPAASTTRASPVHAACSGAIRGHRARGTGILNNELYVGRLVWNRLRYVKDPRTGRRVSRRNDPSTWIIEDVPDLRIVEDLLWERVRARQAEIEAEPRVQAMKESRFWEHRRAQHLLSGLVRCAACGGTFASVGRDYLACSTARKLQWCDQRTGIRRQRLESFVLELVREHLMQPDAVRAFISAYHQEINAGRDVAEAERGQTEKELRTVSRKLEGMYDAIADGLRTPGLLAKIEGLESQKAELEAKLDAPSPSPVRLHPNLADLYRQKTAALCEALADPTIRDEAVTILRGLIEEVRLGFGPEGWTAELQGEITSLVSLGMQNNRAPRPGLRVEALCSAKVVAGARNQFHLLFAAYDLCR